jgi:EAL domain-containing protein (putative c-di-GMP-specific phosphodiesterase class I)/CHASE2 domain-containing sensor protein
MGGNGNRSERLRAVRRDPRVRALFWTTLLALLFGVLDLGRQIEQTLYLARAPLRQHKVSGDIVVVGLDDRSLAAIPQLPWPRRYHAQLADRLRELGARRVFYDFDFSLPSQPRDDKAFADALARLGQRGVIAVRFWIDPVTGKRAESASPAEFRRHAHQANIQVPFRAQGAVWEAPYALPFAQGIYSSFSAALAGVPGRPGELFPIDYSLDLRTIPVVSAIDVLHGRASASAFKGKDVVIGPISPQLGDIYLIPGNGRNAGVYLHVMGAETLKEGRPVPLGWPLPLLLGFAAASYCLFSRRPDRAGAVAVVSVALLLFGPIFLEAHRIYVAVVPGLLLLLGSVGARSWSTFRRAYRERGTINPISGLPNLNALRKARPPGSSPLIAARVQNYAQICAALQTDEERTLAGQIASRLTVGAVGATVYQGDEGIFAWFAPAHGDLEEHLGALHALFRSPVLVAESRFDLSITFGVDTGPDRSIARRLGGALAAADEAARESRRWKRYEPGKDGDAAWRLSILSQLDSAIGAGDLWVAYQPKFDVATRQAIGAEALVRWTHPVKGPISPMEFIPAAEQSGRIEKLTEFVFDRAIRAGSLAVQRCPGFNISVNLSPKLLGAFPLEAKVLELLAAYGLPPECLTLEVTETAALARAEADLAPLHRLRARGVQISIDDYGTGLSTLDYIKRLPATEIKIDKSFVQAVGKSRSDRLMVHSTIQLAHSLGHKVVAEGVEDVATFETLAGMGCDIVQGFYFAKPMTFNNLTALIPGWRKAEVA